MATMELNNLKYSLMEELMSIDNKETLNQIKTYFEQLKNKSQNESESMFKEELLGADTFRPNGVTGINLMPVC
ncbi:hypothetical protein [Phocaeicola sp.]